MDFKRVLSLTTAAPRQRRPSEGRRAAHHRHIALPRGEGKRGRWRSSARSSACPDQYGGLRLRPRFGFCGGEGEDLQVRAARRPPDTCMMQCMHKFANVVCRRRKPGSAPQGGHEIGVSGSPLRRVGDRRSEISHECASQARARPCNTFMRAPVLDLFLELRSFDARLLN